MKSLLMKRITLFCVILFLGFTTCVYAPYEMFIGNRNEFWFGLRHFWWIPPIIGLVAMTAGVGLGLLLKGKLLRIYTGLLFAFGICAWLQGNFLNLKVGELNGNSILWETYRGRMWMNLAVWLILFVISIRLFLKKYDWMKKAGFYISLLLTAMQLVTLLVIGVPCILEEVREKEEVYQCTEKDIFSLSSEENLLIFLVDMCDDTYFEQALAGKPDMVDELDGFVRYTNNVGAYEYTRLALPMMLTGHKFLNEQPRLEWLNRVCEDKVYWDYLLEDGYELGIYSDDELIPQRLKRSSVNCLNVDSKINYYRNFSMDLYQFVMCKYLPDLLKPEIWMSGTEFNRWKELDSEYLPWYFDTNITLSKKFGGGQFDISKEKKQFKFIHMLGSHGPYDLQPDGSWQPGVNTDAVTCTQGSFALIDKYLKQMKQLGVYDSASIVILADHGYNEQKYRNPVLLIKEPESHGRMTENNAPVSHWDFVPTIMALAGLSEEVPGMDGRPVMEIEAGETRERLHYFSGEKAKNGNEVLVEYTVSPESNKPEAYHPTGYLYDTEGNRVKCTD